MVVLTSTSSHQVYMVYEMLTSSVYGERTPTSSHHVYVGYTLLTVHIKCIWSTNFYKFTSSVYGVYETCYKLTSSVYGERTPTSSHHVYVVYTLLTVHIKCIWCTKFYKFTTSTSSHQVYMVIRTSTSSHQVYMVYNFYKFTSSVYGERTQVHTCVCGVHTSNSSH